MNSALETLISVTVIPLAMVTQSLIPKKLGTLDVPVGKPRYSVPTTPLGPVTDPEIEEPFTQVGVIIHFEKAKFAAVVTAAWVVSTNFKRASVPKLINLGKAVADSMPRMTMTMINSTSVNAR